MCQKPCLTNVMTKNHTSAVVVDDVSTRWGPLSILSTVNWAEEHLYETTGQKRRWLNGETLFWLQFDIQAFLWLLNLTMLFFCVFRELSEISLTILSVSLILFNLWNYAGITAQTFRTSTTVGVCFFKCVLEFIFLGAVVADTLRALSTLSLATHQNTCIVFISF